MRKSVLTLILAIALLIPTGLFAQAQEDAPYKLFGMGTLTTNKDFSETPRGSFEVGAIFDWGNGLSFRSSYQQINFCGYDDAKSLNNAVMLDWFLGKDFYIYILFGLATNIDGQYQGSDAFTGFGVSMSVWKWYQDGTFIPGGVDIFAEIKSVDYELLDNSFQFNIGFTISKPVTK